MSRTIEIPPWEKVNLTIEEAAVYSNIGVNRISNLLKNPNCRFVLHVGTKNLVKRKKFEEYLQTVTEL